MTHALTLCLRKKTDAEKNLFDNHIFTELTKLFYVDMLNKIHPSRRDNDANYNSIK